MPPTWRTAKALGEGRLSIRTGVQERAQVAPKPRAAGHPPPAAMERAKRVTMLPRALAPLGEVRACGRKRPRAEAMPSPHPSAPGNALLPPSPSPAAAVATLVGKTTRRKRARIGSDFASQAELEAAKRAREVDELVATLPEVVATSLLGGELAAQQVPCPQERVRVLKSAVAHKAGPDGGTLANAARAWAWPQMPTLPTCPRADSLSYLPNLAAVRSRCVCRRSLTGCRQRRRCAPQEALRCAAVAVAAESGTHIRYNHSVGLDYYLIIP